MTDGLDPLNEMRRELGEFDGDIPALDYRATPILARASLSDASSAGGYPSVRLADGTRLGLLVVMVACGVMAAVHQPLLHGLEHMHNGWAGTAVSVIGWPMSGFQPVMAGSAALALVILAGYTDGFTRVSTGQSTALLWLAVVAIIGALPVAIFLLIYAVVVVVMVAIVVAVICIIIFALLSS